MSVKLFFLSVGLMILAGIFFFFTLGSFFVERENRRIGQVALWFCLGLASLGSSLYVIAAIT
ncbi:hypothetical protein SAMN05216483_6455 [Streptomyces sp. 2131.1]|uniref:hypothetical protein n=1 Tax=Streptomyces sp. 2131.1 TaxID=1855346 RepID=UPI0008965422|nr:hypothetical protein [Streptomyces sp. 2131.1]SEE51020.1 hypothetical protein SAMN05216483_6455 [Streptomyces sp. 2131.1]